MAFDIKGGLKNTAASRNKYVVFEELLSNSIDAYLIRNNSGTLVLDCKIIIEVEFIKKNLIEPYEYELIVTCTDNGIGFGNEQIKAFVTKDSTYKDYLNISGIGKCKGAGRIQYFHNFNKLNIDSVFYESEKNKVSKVNLSLDSDSKEINEDTFIKTISYDGNEPYTKIVLSCFKSEHFSEKLDPSISVRELFSANNIREHIYYSFLQRFVMIKNIVKNFSISFIEKEDDSSEEVTINSDALPTPIEQKNIKLLSGKNSDLSHNLMITRYSLDQNIKNKLEHQISLCANYSSVFSLTKYFLKNILSRSTPINGKIELLLVESSFFDETVNVQRDNFSFIESVYSSGININDFTLDDVILSLEDYICSIVTPSDFDKVNLIKSTQEKFGISQEMLTSANIKIHFGDTEENIAKRTLKKLQDDIVSDTSNIFNLKKELETIDPRSNDFRDKLNKLSWQYASSIKKIDMTNLSQLIVRRSSIIEILKRAVNLELDCQNSSLALKREDEKIIHNIFFPTGKNNNEFIDHDIWILSEEYHYFEHISSDKALSTIVFNDDGDKLFSSDIDSELEKLFKNNNENHQRKRPDIAIFNKEGSAIIIEFKAPNVGLQEHIPDLAQYARLLAAKSNGKLKKFYGYLIGTEIDDSRMPTNFTMFPSGLGYFSSGPLAEPRTSVVYGELYSEVLFYNQFIERAENRLNIYKKKLNFSL